MIVLLCLFCILYFLFTEVSLFLAILLILLIPFIICFFNYIILFLYVKNNKNKILRHYSIPKIIKNNNLSFKNLFNKFFLNKIKIVCKTNHGNLKFKYSDVDIVLIPFHIGYHGIKNHYLLVYDIFGFFYKKIKLEEYDFEIILTNIDQIESDFETNSDIEKFKKNMIKNDSFYMRDYLPGDDPRKIIWRSYLNNSNLQYIDDWFEKSDNNIIKIFVDNLKSEKYKLTELFIIKTIKFCKYFLNKKYIIYLNGEEITNVENLGITLNKIVSNTIKPKSDTNYNIQLYTINGFTKLNCKRIFLDIPDYNIHEKSKYAFLYKQSLFENLTKENIRIKKINNYKVLKNEADWII